MVFFSKFLKNQRNEKKNTHSRLSHVRYCRTSNASQVAILHRRQFSITSVFVQLLFFCSIYGFRMELIRKVRSHSIKIDNITKVLKSIGEFAIIKMETKQSHSRIVDMLILLFNNLVEFFFSRRY